MRETFITVDRNVYTSVDKSAHILFARESSHFNFMSQVITRHNPRLYVNNDDCLNRAASFSPRNISSRSHLKAHRGPLPVLHRVPQNADSVLVRHFYLLKGYST